LFVYFVAVKKMHADLSTILNEMAEMEIQDLPEYVAECVVTYYPEIGFLLTIKEWDEGLTRRQMMIPGYEYKVEYSYLPDGSELEPIRSIKCPIFLFGSVY